MWYIVWANIIDSVILISPLQPNEKENPLPQFQGPHFPINIYPSIHPSIHLFIYLPIYLYHVCLSLYLNIYIHRYIAYIHTFCHTHTHIHTYIHTHIYKHTYIHTYIAYIHIHSHTHIYIHTYTNIHTYIHVWLDVSVAEWLAWLSSNCGRIGAIGSSPSNGLRPNMWGQKGFNPLCQCVYIYVCIVKPDIQTIHRCSHTSIHTYIHTYIDTYIHTWYKQTSLAQFVFLLYNTE